MTTSLKGIALIVSFEKVELNAYRDIAGVPTIGVGATMINGRPVKMTDTLPNNDAAMNLLHQQLGYYENQVNLLVKAKLNQNQFDALVSFIYNLGPADFAHSSLRDLINANPNDPAIGVHWMQWDHAKVAGKEIVVHGLEIRRATEYNLYKS